MNDAGINPVLTAHEVRELQLLIEQRSGMVFDESRERFLTSRVVEHMQRKRLSYGMELLRLVRTLQRGIRHHAGAAADPGDALPALSGTVFRIRATRAAADARAQVLGQGSGIAHLERGLCQRRRAVLDRTEHLRGDRLRQRHWTPASRPPTSAAKPWSAPTAESIASACWKIFRRPQIANYFTRKRDGYKVKPVLREMVKFAPMNLAQPLYLGRFDCIFCMNVLIYFSEELRRRLIQRFYEYLEPGGYLFLGHAESVG